MSTMMSNEQLLTSKWKNYFNWTFVYPVFILFLFFAIGGFIVYASIDDPTATHSFIAGVGGIFFLAFFLAVFSIPYVIWFFLASDKLFQLLGMDRTLSNILNIGGFLLFGGLPLLVTPIVLWFKVNNHWEERGLNHNWRGLLK